MKYSPELKDQVLKKVKEYRKFEREAANGELRTSL